MFAPPPLVPLSVAEIEARLAGTKKKVDELTTQSKTPRPKSAPEPRDVRKSPRFARHGRKLSKNSTATRDSLAVKVAGRPPEIPPFPKEMESISLGMTDELTIKALPLGFGEHPRSAPTPPRLSTQSPRVLWSPPSSPPPDRPLPNLPDAHDIPPPLPKKSPKRKLTAPATVLAKVVANRDSSVETSLSNALSILQVKEDLDPDACDRPNSLPPTFKTASSDATRDRISPTTDQVGSNYGTYSRSSANASKLTSWDTSRAAGSRDAGVVKSDLTHRPTALASILAAFADLDEVRSSTASTAVLKEATTPNTAGDSLVGLGAIKDVTSYIAPLKISKANHALKKHDEIHTNPESSRQRAARRIARKSHRLSSKRRKLLEDATNESANAHDKRPHGTTSANIAEYKSMVANTPFDQSPITPKVSRINAQGQLTVKASCPERTARCRRMYLYGPIKLVLPVVMPRKGSLASMDLFQESVNEDRRASAANRRRVADEQVMDEICDFFDSFCFDPVRFDLDPLLPIITHEQQTDRADATAQEDMNSICNWLSKAAPDVVENVLAGAVIQITPDPPLDIAETSQVGSGVRCSRSPSQASHPTTARKDSFTSWRAETKEFGPTEKRSLLGLLQQASSGDTQIASERHPVGRGRELEDELQEFDTTSVWVAPKAAPKHHKARLEREPRPRETRNPMKKMRRLWRTPPQFSSDAVNVSTP